MKINDYGMAYKMHLGLDLTQALSWFTVTSGYDVILFCHRLWPSMFSQHIKLC